jgi:hypothetical protein
VGFNNSGIFVFCFFYCILFLHSVYSGRMLRTVALKDGQTDQHAGEGADVASAKHRTKKAARAAPMLEKMSNTIYYTVWAVCHCAAYIVGLSCTPAPQTLIECSGGVCLPLSS